MCAQALWLILLDNEFLSFIDQLITFKLSLQEFTFLILKIFAEYFAEWENVRARVVRPDVQCTDGVIHVIDHVLVQRREISVSGQGRITADFFTFIALVFVSITFLNVRP